MENLIKDIRYGVRMFTKNPGVTLVAVVTLALGIGANTAIFSGVNALVMRPLPVPKAHQLVRPMETTEDRGLTVWHVAGKDRPAKPRALHAREPDVVAFTERDGAELRQRLAEEHPRKDGGSGKVAREVRLVRRHELHARRPDAELDVQDAVDEWNAEPARADGAFGYELGARGPTPPWRPPAWHPP